MEQITIRQATAEDAKDLFDILTWFVASFTPEKTAFENTLKHLLNDDTVCLNVAVIKDKVIGFCLAFDHYTFYANGRVTWVEELAVNETHRKKGIGKSLMLSIEKWAKERDSKLVALATRRAPEFYNAIGYEESATYFLKYLTKIK